MKNHIQTVLVSLLALFFYNNPVFLLAALWLGTGFFAAYYFVRENSSSVYAFPVCVFLFTLSLTGPMALLIVLLVEKDCLPFFRHLHFQMPIVWKKTK